MKKTRLFLKIVIFFAYFSVLLGVGELALRFFWPIKGGVVFSHPPVYYRLNTDPNIGYGLRPSTADVNSDGLRDVEHSVEKKEGVVRIAVIGDSIAYGIGVKREETYAKELEKILNYYNPGHYEVLNFGVPGYGIVQVLNRFKYKGLKYKPDIVIYGYWFNDFHRFGCSEDEYPFFSSMAATAWEAYTYAAVRCPWVAPLRNFILQSELFKRITYLFYELHGGNVFRPQYTPSFTTDPQDEIIKQWYNRFLTCTTDIAKNNDITFLDKEVDWKSFKRYWLAFDELSRLCRKRSIRFVVLLTPVLGNFSDYQYLSLQNFVKDLALSFGAEVVDTLDDFRANYKISGDDIDKAHFDISGHRLVADRLAQYLEPDYFE